MSTQRTGRGVRHLTFGAILLFLFSILLTYAVAPVTVLGAHDVGLFELDANADDSAAPGADWENGPEGAADDFFAGANTEASANDNTYFTTGGSKDENDIPSWAITGTPVPDKDELTDAYAAVYQLQGDTWVYFGADRFDNDGTAQIGFWFFQNEVGIKNGDFTGKHKDGDVLIISEYTNGGVVSTICAYEWDGSGGGSNINNSVGCDPATNGSNLNLVAAGAQCDTGDGTFDICAVTNGDTENAPWTFTNKDGEHNFAPGQFYEGGFNLSDMFGGDAPCFGTFLAETRSSAETDAQLKDFALGDFNTCVPPTITTQSSNSTRDFGQQVTDTANLSGNNGPVTGTVDFFICGPTEVTSGGCEGNAGTKVGSSVTIVAGAATSDAYTVGLTAAAAGKYCWRAEYTPDASSEYLAGSHTNAGNECFTVAPATIKIEKTANPAGPVNAGGEIGFDIKVSNTGNGTALNVSVSDNLPAGIVWTADSPTGSDSSGVSCSINTVPNPDVLTCTDASLPAGGTWTVHIHGATDAADCGTVNNTASVTTSNDGSDSDSDSVLVGCPELSIDKVDNTGSYDSVGDVIHYSIKVTNTGNVTLHDVVVTDPNAANLDCTPATPVASLAPGAEINCTADHTVTQADLDAGHYANEACTDDGNGDGATGAAPVCDDVDTPGEQNPELSIVKSDGDATYSKVGDVIHYTITATNTGNVTLHDVVITDPKAANLDCTPVTPVADLAPGAEINCTAEHTVTQADIDAGSYLNTACVDDEMGQPGTGADEACDDENTPGSQNPELQIVKDDGGFTFSKVGDVIPYTITVTNIGNVTLSNVEVTDTLAVGLDCSADPGIQTTIASLAPGASFECTASHVVTQEDLDNGSYLNTACADDSGPAAKVCDDEDTPGEQNPALSITKDATEASFDSVGDVIHYTIVATNTGNVTLHGVDVTDPNVTDLDCTPATPVDLAPGDSITCTASHTVTQDDLDAGHFFNEACADDGQGPAEKVCDNVDTPGEQSPALAIDKQVTETQYTKVGQVLHYTIVVTNVGSITLHDVIVTDAQVTDLVCVPPTPVATLAVGASFTCTATHTIVQADLDTGFFTNVACADDENGEPETGADSVCDEVTTFGQEVKEETPPPTLPNTAADSVGGPSSPSNGSWLLILAFATLLASVVLVTPRRSRQQK